MYKNKMLLNGSIRLSRQDDSLIGDLRRNARRDDLSMSPVTVISRARGNKRETAAPFTGTEADEPSRFGRSLSPVARMRRYSAHGVFESARGRDRHPATRRAVRRIWPLIRQSHNT